MHPHIRLAGPDDLSAYLEFRNTPGFAPLTEQAFLDGEARRDPASAFTRLLLSLGGRVVGEGTLQGNPYLPAGVLHAHVVILPEARGIGLGAELATALEAEARRHSALSLEAAISTRAEGARRWAERMGYAVYTEQREAVAEVAHAPVVPLPPQIDVRVLPDPSPAEWRACSALAAALLPDTPDLSGQARWDEARFFAEFRDGPGVPYVLSVAARDGRWVGVSIAGRAGAGALHNAFTGVAREERGRGVALALKGALLAYARETGASTITTLNDARNVAMLAVNDRLGYQTVRGRWRLRKALVSTD